MTKIKSVPQFNKTYCSQCGGEFGPGNSGFSHCDQHVEKIRFDNVSPTIKSVMMQFESALARRRAYGPPLKH